jgi:hypothetical protein
MFEQTQLAKINILKHLKLCHGWVKVAAMTSRVGDGCCDDVPNGFCGFSLA